MVVPFGSLVGTTGSTTVPTSRWIRHPNLPTGRASGAGWVRWLQASVIVMVSPSAGIRSCVESIPASLAAWRSACRVTGA